MPPLTDDNWDTTMQPMDTPTTADWQSRTRGNVALHVVALIGLAALCCWATAGFPGYLT